MKKKILFVLVTLCAFSFAATAQLTTGNPSSKEIRTGNRPQAGDFGLYLGYGSTDIIHLINGSGYPLPVINLKYYLSNQLELRVGIDSEIESESFKGKLTGATEKSGTHVSESQFLLQPGIAYHFSKHNIIDVYAGAEVPLGYYGVTDRNFDKGAGTLNSAKRNLFQIGLKPFIGLQCFVANLPVAIGVEYGFSANSYLGAKWKYVAEAGGTKQVYYTLPGMTAPQYDKLSSSTFSLEHDVRITLSYYFK